MGKVYEYWGTDNTLYSGRPTNVLMQDLNPRLLTPRLLNYELNVFERIFQT